VPAPTPAKPIEAEIERARRLLGYRRVLAARRRMHPADWYEPHHTCTRAPQDPALAGYSRVGKPSGQLQFHQSTHAIRFMAPGNGWGGSQACACEVDAWMRHTNRWQATPPHPIHAVWIAPTLDQFDALYHDLLRPKCWGAAARFSSEGALGGKRLVWPDGGFLQVVTHRTSWTDVQGTNPDLVVFDETPPRMLWMEMMQRRRGETKTRYIGKATQTEGITFMAETAYKPWLAYHAERGLGEEEAMAAQLHPFLWVWPKGGVHDNSGLSVEDDLWYESQRWATAKEREVRLFGGFKSFVANGLFDESALDRLRARALELDSELPGDAGMLVIEPWTPEVERPVPGLGLIRSEV